MKPSLLFILWTTDCTKFFSSETYCCECQWTEAEQSRMQLITAHPDAPGAAFSIITSNCHLLIHIGFHISCYLCIVDLQFLTSLKFQSFQSSSFCPFGCRPWAVSGFHTHSVNLRSFCNISTISTFSHCRWKCASKLKFLAMTVNSCTHKMEKTHLLLRPDPTAQRQLHLFLGSTPVTFPCEMWKIPRIIGLLKCSKRL